MKTPAFGALVLHVVLFRPQIPPNTGNVGRLCAVTGCRLHLVHPLGFRITDRHLRRSGMDYWHELDVQHHASWEAFRGNPSVPRRLWLLTTHAERTIWETAFEPEDGLVFGNENEGAPAWLHEEIGATARIRIPQMQPGLRSLNLSTSVGIAVYEALRQLASRGRIAPTQDRGGQSQPASHATD